MKRVKHLVVLCLISLSLLSLFAFSASPSLAVESSASSKLIEQKLSELKISIASRAAKIKEDLTKRLQNKVLVGEVLSTENKLIQISADNETRDIITSEYTDTPKAKISVGNFLIALGEIDDKNSLVARKVLVSLRPQELEQKIIWGQITSVQKDLLSFKPKESTLSGLLVDKNTNITSTSKDLTLADIKEGTIVVAIGTQKQDKLQTRFITVIANKTVKLPKSAVASSSATPSAVKKK